MHETNWAGNVSFGAREEHRPTGLEQLRALLAGGGRVRALGTGHSFSPVADTTGLLLRLDRMPAVVEVDSGRRQAHVAAGLRYADLVGPLDAAGFALPNLASLPHLSVAGAVSTGTHGSGVRNGGLACAVAAVDLVTAGGDLVHLRRGDPGFDGAVVALGCLGVVIGLDLDLVPSFRVRQLVYEDVGIAALRDNLAEAMGRAYSVSAFTQWRPDGLTRIWVKELVDDELAGPVPPTERWLGGRLADCPVHMIAGMSADSCTAQLGAAGAWHDRLPHFRAQAAPSSRGDELQSEYLVPAGDGVAALDALREVAPAIAGALQVCEVRAVAGDQQWLSPAHQQDSIAVHFTWVADLTRVLPAVRTVEAALAALQPRPHWGKVFDMDPATVAGRYPRLADFVALAAQLDPAGRLRNDFVDRYIFGGRS